MRNLHNYYRLLIRSRRATLESILKKLESLFLYKSILENTPYDISVLMDK